MLLASAHREQDPGKGAKCKCEGEKHCPVHADSYPEYMGLNRGGILHYDNDGNNTHQKRGDLLCVFHFLVAPLSDF